VGQKKTRKAEQKNGEEAGCSHRIKKKAAVGPLEEQNERHRIKTLKDQPEGGGEDEGQAGGFGDRWKQELMGPVELSGCSGHGVWGRSWGKERKQRKKLDDQTCREVVGTLTGW